MPGLLARECAGLPLDPAHRSRALREARRPAGVGESWISNPRGVCNKDPGGFAVRTQRGSEIKTHLGVWLFRTEETRKA